MSDLSDEDIATDLVMMERENYMAPRWQRGIAALRELQRHRAAQRADAERVRSVVRDVLLDEVPNRQQRERIADRVAAELATAAPVCSTCNDTHTMTVGGRDVMCTRCPTPCESCRQRAPGRGGGPYCQTTPCACSCHASSPAVAPVLSEEDRALVFALRERIRRMTKAAHMANPSDELPLLKQGMALDRMLATAAPASAPVLSAEEREAIAWLLSYVPSPDSVGGNAEAHLIRLGIACVRRLRGGGS